MSGFVLNVGWEWNSKKKSPTECLGKNLSLKYIIFGIDLLYNFSSTFKILKTIIQNILKYNNLPFEHSIFYINWFEIQQSAENDRSNY